MVPVPRRVAALLCVAFLIASSLVLALGPASQAAAGDWEDLPKMSTPRAMLAAAAGSDGRIYALGGDDAVVTMEAYNPGTNTWVSDTPMTTPRLSFAATAGPGGRIYALGGQPSLATAEVYTPGPSGVPGAWAPIPPMATGRKAPAATAGRGSDARVYAIGGATDGTPTDSVEAYSPGLAGSPGAWVPVKAMDVPRTALAATTGLDGRVYALGGSSDGLNPLATVEVGSGRGMKI